MALAHARECTNGWPTKWVPINDNGTTRYFPTLKEGTRT